MDGESEKVDNLHLFCVRISTTDEIMKQNSDNTENSPVVRNHSKLVREGVCQGPLN